jgi:hypothetical protein
LGASAQQPLKVFDLGENIEAEPAEGFVELAE